MVGCGAERIVWDSGFCCDGIAVGSCWLAHADRQLPFVLRSVSRIFGFLLERDEAVAIIDSKEALVRDLW